MKREGTLSAKLSRRDFLKSCALVAGGLAATTVVAEVATPLVFQEKLEFDENKSVWVLSGLPASSPLDADLDVDVAVIGGGYTGLSSAYYLLQRYPEKSVAVFEAKSVGHGASGRNGGMLLPQSSNEYMNIASDPQTHRLVYDVTVKNMNDLEELLKTQSIDYDLRRNGALLVIAKESHVEQYRQYAEQAHSLEMPIEFWDRDRTRSEIGTDVYYASLYEPNAAEVHPMKLAYALKNVAEAAGAHIYESSPVLEMEEDGETVRLVVGERKHKVTAKAVVLATNAYTSKLGYFRNSMFPLNTPMAVTPQLPESTFADIGWKKEVGYSDTYMLLYHLSRTPDNRILIGSGYVNYFFNNGVVNQDDVRMLKAFLQKELTRIYPKLSGIDFEYVWTGVIACSIDLTQSVGVMGAHKNIYYGLGYAGHGINLATLFGRIIADIYAGEERKWQGLPFLNHNFIPLPPEPLKWVGVQSTIAYYKTVDWSKW